ncbi:hypothetical protein ABR33_05840 [Enterobacter bugandensis]|uniref:hypothetical protein n=1 Tax=Enterobacter bugandensis TaxID=881260 RepID=UPI0006439AA8|nr:hypothetical protein [Enterobacter bugandensis]KLQ32516.1 hypothetical protein ABR33_05840 [Enterobacter bugandensis]
MKEITTTPAARVFEITPRGGFVTLALAYHPQTDEPEIAVMVSGGEQGNTFLSRGVGVVVMARTIAHFGGQMPTIDQVLEFNNTNGADKIHQAILAGYSHDDVMAIWKFHESKGKPRGIVDLPIPAAEADVEETIKLLSAQAQGNA